MIFFPDIHKAMYIGKKGGCHSPQFTGKCDAEKNKAAGINQAALSSMFSVY